MPQKFVIVRHPNGQVGPMPEVAARTAGYEVLDRPVRRRDGRLAPTKNYVPLGGANKSADEADAARVTPNDKKARSGSVSKEK